MGAFRIYCPVKPKQLNQGFGLNPQIYGQFGLQGHNGLDLFTEHGQPVYASHDGTCYPEIDTSQGHGVRIRSEEDHEWNGQTVRFETIYWHFVQCDAVVKTGQGVRTGDLIGFADSTGFSTGDHLHFGLKPKVWDHVTWTWKNAAQDNGFLGAIDPTPFFADSYAVDYPATISLLTKFVAVLSAMVAELKK